MARIYSVVPSMLLLERINKELERKELIRKMYRSEDIIWQQMRWEHFDSFMCNGSLYCKMYGEYTDEDEKRLQNHKMICGGAEKKIQGRLADIERQLYISCWYNSADLSDVVFKQYAGDGSGVAIGTTIRDLCNAIQDEGYRYYVGNVQYLPQRFFEQVLFEPAQFIAPVYLKGMQFKMDHEFRLCVFDEIQGELQFNSEEEEESRQKIADREVAGLREEIKKKGFNVGDIKKMDAKLKERLKETKPCASKGIKVDKRELLKYIAVKNDSIFAGLGDEEIINFFNERYKLNLKRESGFGGFKVFKVTGWEESA